MKKEQEIAEKKLTAARHREKQLERERQRLTRSERTHRLCTRGGMLEGFLKEPAVLTDEDVMELLTLAFREEVVQDKLEGLLNTRRKEASQGEDI